MRAPVIRYLTKVGMSLTVPQATPDVENFGQSLPCTKKCEYKVNIDEIWEGTSEVL